MSWLQGYKAKRTRASDALFIGPGVREPVDVALIAVSPPHEHGHCSGPAA